MQNCVNVLEMAHILPVLLHVWSASSSKPIRIGWFNERAVSQFILIFAIDLTAKRSDFTKLKLFRLHSGDLRQIYLTNEAVSRFDELLGQRENCVVANFRFSELRQRQDECGDSFIALINYMQGNF